MGTSRSNDGVRRWLAAHFSVIARAKALELGLSEDEVERLLRWGEWERLHRGVYRPATAPRGPLQSLYGACLAAGEGAMASHRSAAWLWDLVDAPPTIPEISVPTWRNPRIKHVTVHRSRDLRPFRTRTHKGIRTTDPLLTLIDFAAIATRLELMTATDRALARHLTAVPRIETGLHEIGRQGRPGVAALRRDLRDRGVIGAPNPSVLESMTIRLFVRSNLPIPKVELIVGPDGEYRLDFSHPEIKLAIEVDGYAYHYSPDHQQRDHLRRNALLGQGWRILVYTWVVVTRESRRVADEIRALYAA